MSPDPFERGYTRVWFFVPPETTDPGAEQHITTTPPYDSDRQLRDQVTALCGRELALPPPTGHHHWPAFCRPCFHHYVGLYPTREYWHR